ncbi:5-methyltetrahydropteroyltriglutamate--homocysteine S-methyltransferase [Belnapia rosea]|uniref:5-methyltetrahydropteroyltriglutamate--homocysteine methyltransferase n=1 Tax=Belnapia rosea TaxID=938405 RepID=A0A1G6LCN7_9PROT|nr:5-methyltetrahydropteroyltriglutamate--homocysteine S-methyltransferase [Belnapia rosea]SDC40386.1 methionine synthase (B12-independent) [Belnapia rosea]
MTIAANLGYPRIGPHRELKFALEAFWAGTASEAELQATAVRLRTASRALQQGAGINHIPSGDFALYDHVLETAAALGTFSAEGEGPLPLASLFRLARGAGDTPALEMTKWFDTNYHYLVPRLSAGQRFHLAANPWADAVREGLAQHCRTRPVLLGPVSFLMLAKSADGTNPLALLPALLPAYAAALRGIAEAGAAWVQIDEPCLATDLPAGAAEAFETAYRSLAEAAPGLCLLLCTYFGGLRENLPLAFGLPVQGVHLDLVRDPGQLALALALARRDQTLSLGLVDGRNVWRTDLRAALNLAGRAAGHRLMVAPSCSLLHVPHGLRGETALDPALRRRLAFAEEKLGEVVALARALDEGEAAIAALLRESDAVAAERRAEAPPPALAPEPPPRTAYATRAALQQVRLNLPPLPTTTIGSFPQTAEIRATRAALARGTLDEAGYEAAMRGHIAEAVRWQEELGIDVPVHGEFERNDMAKYFGERLAGFAFTRNGWVQSYGSRCVAPPIIWRDVARPEPMTVRWSAYAQSLTGRPMKGMLTGPVTLLQWSFVRDDLPRETVCRQIAEAIRAEVLDLEAAGIPIVQIDEPAFREGLPLRATDRAGYLRWAVACFRLCSSGVRDETQIHTHMCYSEFADIIEAIAAMDADVISIETARSRMELLEAFTGFAWPSGIGPGVWDIHSPRIPSAAEMADLLRLALRHLPADRVWANPDCGLKTRGWGEVRPALENLVRAAEAVRAEL